MALTPEQQIWEAIRKSNYILIVFRKNYHIDSLCSALALSFVLKKINKAYDTVCENISISENLSFLPEVNSVSDELEELQKLIITIDMKNNEIDEFIYDLTGGLLNIYITPKFAPLKSENISYRLAPYKYDLIILLDTPDLLSLGEIFETHANFFLETPKINIDHHPSNESYGQINFIRIDASSTSEALFEILKSTNPEFFDKDIATCFLAGIFAKTKSFTSPQVTPRTLHITQELLEMEADRSAIIKNLYRNKTLPTINLWGRALSRLKTDQPLQLAWSVVSEEDFILAGATEKNFEGIVDEFIRDIPGIEIFCIFYQKGSSAHIIMTSFTGKEDVLSLLSAYKPQGTKTLALAILPDTNIIEAEKKVMRELRQTLEKRRS